MFVKYLSQNLGAYGVDSEEFAGEPTNIPAIESNYQGRFFLLSYKSHRIPFNIGGIHKSSPTGDAVETSYTSKQRHLSDCSNYTTDIEIREVMRQFSRAESIEDLRCEVLPHRFFCWIQKIMLKLRVLGPLYSTFFSKV